MSSFSYYSLPDNGQQRMNEKDNYYNYHYYNNLMYVCILLTVRFFLRSSHFGLKLNLCALKCNLEVMYTGQELKVESLGCSASL